VVTFIFHGSSEQKTSFSLKRYTPQPFFYKFPQVTMFRPVNFTTLKNISLQMSDHANLTYNDKAF